MGSVRVLGVAIAVLALLCAASLVGCGGEGLSTPQSTETARPPPVTEQPLLPTPRPAPIDEPFQGAPKFPDVLFLTSAQQKSDLASFLHTSVLQLDRVNPGLPGLVPSGTLVAIPYDYFVAEAKPFAGIAAETRLSKEVLLAYNPALSDVESLERGTRLLMPRLLILSGETQFNAMAERLALSRETLMQANPDLTGTEKLLAGTVLVLPPEDSP